MGRGERAAHRPGLKRQMPGPVAELEAVLARDGLVLLDGGTGTELERRGAAMSEGAWCGLATLTHPEVLRQVIGGPIDRDRKVFAEMKKLGGNMKFTTWAGDRHAVSGKMIVGGDNGTTEFSSDRCDKEADFMTWLFAQSRKKE